MTAHFLRRPKHNVLRGEVCSVRLRIVGKFNNSVVSTTDASSELRDAIAGIIRDSVRGSLGPDFEVADFALLCQNSEVVFRINTGSYVVQSYDSFVKGLKLFVAQVRNSLELLLQTRFEHAVVKSRWCVGPPLVRLQLEGSDTKASVLKSLQQPLSVLLLGTILGSALIPYLNERSNRNKLRHEERIKIAFSIVEQSHETDRRLSNLMNYLVLFRKDHNNRSEPESALKKEQRDALKTFNEMYMSYTGQAWWWHWTVKSEASLSALATPSESKRVAELARDYSDALGQCTDAVSRLWDPFLKNRYDPGDPQNDVLITQASESLTRARKRRNEVAVEMARIFASK